MARTIMFVRHGKTDKATPDSARRLTDEGKAQAERRRKTLGDPWFDLGLHSPAERTLETAVIIGGDPVPTKMVPELMHDSNTDDGKLLDEAFKQLGYATVDDYFAKTAPPTQEALKRYGETAWQATLTAIKDIEPGGSILVVGHAVLVPLIVYTAGNDQYKKVVGRINLGECEAIGIDIDENNKVVLMIHFV